MSEKISKKVYLLTERQQLAIEAMSAASQPPIKPQQLCRFLVDQGLRAVAAELEAKS